MCVPHYPCRDQVIGRRVLPVRICTCPKRDMETEEKQEKKNISTIQTADCDRVKIEISDGGGGGEQNEQEFWVLVREQRVSPVDETWREEDKNFHVLCVAFFSCTQARGRKNFESLLKVGEVLEESRLAVMKKPLSDGMERYREETNRKNSLVKAGKRKRRE